MNEQKEIAERMIILILWIVGFSILGVLAFETLLGIPPGLPEVIGIIAVVVITIWLKENA